MRILLSAFAVFISLSSFAQLTITSGGQLTLTGNVQLTLQNTDLVNNGSFSSGNGLVMFTGNAASNISGTQALQFYGVSVNKSPGISVLLQRPVSISQQLSFNTGYLDLNGFDVDLGSTGSLQNEQESSRVIGANGGHLQFTTTLNNPFAVNPGNLGAIITTGQNLGSVTVRRGHQSQLNGFGNGSSVMRYYDILPANNNSLNATLRFIYFDAELNGLDESGLLLWRSENNLNWSSVGFDLRNTASNYVEKNGIASFSRWTLSSANNPLPVQLTGFNVKCENNNTVVRWTTTQEQNSSHFVIERSADGVQWSVAGTVSAAGNSSVSTNYSFIDTQSNADEYYRLKQVDVGGQFYISGILRSDCDLRNRLFVWPNPVIGQLHVSINSVADTKTYIQVYDSKGALVRIQEARLLRGSNQVSVDMMNLASGTYHVVADVGGSKTTVSVIKQ